jgi:hypothetical protein
MRESFYLLNAPAAACTIAGGSTLRRLGEIKAPAIFRRVAASALQLGDRGSGPLSPEVSKGSL